jgi:hypothetical protein
MACMCLLSVQDSMSLVEAYLERTAALRSQRNACQRHHLPPRALNCRQDNHGQLQLQLQQPRPGQRSIFAPGPGSPDVPRAVKVFCSGPRGPTDDKSDMEVVSNASSLEFVRQLPHLLHV